MASQAELIAREAKSLAESNKIEIDLLSSTIKDLDLLRLRDRVVVLETTVAELKRHKEESEKRNWQFIFIAVGAGCAIVGGIVVQLVASFLRK